MDRKDPLDVPVLSSEEMTRIYRETAAAAASSGDRLTVLLAPYAGTAAGPRPRRRDDSD